MASWLEWNGHCDGGGGRLAASWLPCASRVIVAVV
jgi:hypothetical protein